MSPNITTFIALNAAYIHSNRAANITALFATVATTLYITNKSAFNATNLPTLLSSFLTAIIATITSAQSAAFINTNHDSH
jgi:hypothetical protein